MSSRNALILVLAVAAASLAFAPRQDAPKQDAPKKAAPTQAAPGQDSARRPDGDNRDGEPRNGDRRGGRGLPNAPDWPRAGGFGPGGQNSERPMIEGLVIEGLIPGTFGRRELTNDDVARAIAVAKEISPEWGEAIEARAKSDPEQMKSNLRGSARRLLGMVALKERAPKVFEAKVAELRAQAETDRASKELRKAMEAGSPDEKSLAALRQALDEASAKQVDATLAARRQELDALDARVKKLRADIDADAANRKALAAEVAKHATERPAQREQGARPAPRE